jgi:hypothetical protein
VRQGRPRHWPGTRFARVAARLIPARIDLAGTDTNILKLWPAWWTFTTSRALVSANNAVEPALRSLVPKRKISEPTQSLRGDPFLSPGLTVQETCLRQAVNL